MLFNQDIFPSEVNNKKTNVNKFVYDTNPNQNNVAFEKTIGYGFNIDNELKPKPAAAAGVTSNYVHEVTLDSIEDNEADEITFDPLDQPLSMPYAKVQTHMFIGFFGTALRNHMRIVH